MIITVNEQTVVIPEIKKAKTIAEAVTSINRWIASQGDTLIKIYIDNNAFDLAVIKESGGEKSCEGISTIQCQCQNTLSLMIESLNSLLEYLLRLQEKIPTIALQNEEHTEELARKDLEDLSKGIQTIIRVFLSIQALLNIKEDFRGGGKTLEDCLKSAREWEEKMKNFSPGNESFQEIEKDLPDFLSHWKLMTAKLLEEVQKKVLVMKPPETVLSELEEAKKNINNLEEETEEIATLLQTGSGPQAMEKLSTSILGLESIYALFQQTQGINPNKFKTIAVGDETLESFNQTMITILQQVVEAFQQQDYVLLGDLLEYEIGPLSRKLLPFLEECKIFLQDEINND